MGKKAKGADLLAEAGWKLRIPDGWVTEFSHAPTSAVDFVAAEHCQRLALVLLDLGATLPAGALKEIKNGLLAFADQIAAMRQEGARVRGIKGARKRPAPNPKFAAVKAQLAALSDGRRYEADVVARVVRRLGRDGVAVTEAYVRKIRREEFPRN